MREMLARLACPFALAVTTTLAGASPPEIELGHQQLELAPRRDVLDETSREPWYRFVGFAQLTAGGRAGGDAGVGAAAAVAGLNCDLAAGTAHGRLRPFAEDGEAMGEVTYSVCPLGALMTMKFDGRRAMGVAPGLDARRSLWNRHYTEVYDRVELAVGPIWDEDSDPRHSIMLIALGHGTTTQHDGPETRTMKSIDLDFTLYRYERPRGLRIDAIALTTDALKAGSDHRGGVATMFAPLRLRYEAPHVWAAASAGWGFSGGTITASSETQVNDQTTSSWSETVDSEGLPELTMVVGDVEAGVRRDRLSASTRVARSLYATFDGNVAREARVAGNVTYVVGRSRRTSVSLAPFAMRTRTWVRDAAATLDHAAGASLHVGRELSSRLRVDAIGQAGISPYSRTDAERLGAGVLGGQVVVAVSGRVTDLHAHLPR